MSVWDGDLAAFLAALDDHPDHRDAIGRALREELGRDVEGEEKIEQSEVLRLALRLGLAEAAPEYTDTLREAITDWAADSL